MLSFSFVIDTTDLRLFLETVRKEAPRLPYVVGASLVNYVYRSFDNEFVNSIGFGVKMGTTGYAGSRATVNQLLNFAACLNDKELRINSVDLDTWRRQEYLNDQAKFQAASLVWGATYLGGGDWLIIDVMSGLPPCIRVVDELAVRSSVTFDQVFMEGWDELRTLAALRASGPLRDENDFDDALGSPQKKNGEFKEQDVLDEETVPGTDGPGGATDGSRGAHTIAAAERDAADPQPVEVDLDGLLSDGGENFFGEKLEETQPDLWAWWLEAESTWRRLHPSRLDVFRNFVSSRIGVPPALIIFDDGYDPAAGKEASDVEATQLDDGLTEEQRTAMIQRALRQHAVQQAVDATEHLYFDVDTAHQAYALLAGMVFNLHRHINGWAGDDLSVQEDVAITVALRPGEGMDVVLWIGETELNIGDGVVRGPLFSPTRLPARSPVKQWSLPIPTPTPADEATSGEAVDENRGGDL